MRPSGSWLTKREPFSPGAYSCFCGLPAVQPQEVVTERMRTVLVVLFVKL